jgi:uncharacterized protein YcfL
MKRLICVGLMVLAGCSSTVERTYPQQTMILDKEVQAMSRNEVIVAVQECEASGLRANMIFAKRRINGYLTDIVADVTCAPRFKY